MDRKMPVLFNRKEDCTGCTACYSICTNNAIIMKSDNTGFLYPFININKCVSCYMCINVCPITRKTNH